MVSKVWVAGSFPPSVLMGSDSGGAWHSRRFHVSSDIAFCDVTFADALHGWVVGSSGEVRATTDGGVTWQRQRSGTSWSLARVACTDSRHAWAADTNGGIIATSDGGASWVRQREIGGGASIALRGIAFGDALHGWAVGLGRGGGVILATSDGGAHWRVQHRLGLPAGVGFTSVAGSDGKHCWVVGGVDPLATGAGSSAAAEPPNFILATSDGGASWREQYSSSTHRPLEVAVVDAKHVWAVGWSGPGASGLVLVTRDGGATWRSRPVPAPVPREARILRDVAFSDVEHGWTVAGGGAILTTGNGGETWSAVALPKAARSPRILWRLASRGSAQ
jgi:photosystem II stability/assembly factor-like uncharacterized protein